MARFVKNPHLLGLLLAAMLGGIMSFVPWVEAASFLPLPSGDSIDIPQPEGDTGLTKLENILGPIGLVIRIIMGAIAVMLIVIAGFSMAIAGDNEENVKTQKTSITYAIIGLMMISIAGPIAEVFDFRVGNPLQDPDSFIARARLFDGTTQIVITFVKYFLGAAATLVFIVHGGRMVTSLGNDEAVSKSRKGMGLAAAGLMMVIFSELIVRRIFFDVEYNDFESQTVVAINQNELITQIVAITNLIVTFVSPIMLLGLIVGAVLYIVAGGDEERVNLAKKIMTNSVIGLVVIYGAFGLVSTVIIGVF
jgi:hypothetical protein